MRGSVAGYAAMDAPMRLTRVMEARVAEADSEAGP